MDLDELKRKRRANFLAHKKKKREYYLKKKLENKAKNSQSTAIDYESELNSGDFALKLKEIAKKQKKHVDNRKDIIIQKLKEYKDKKQQYYQENREKRLEYDKEYRERKKEELKEYRKRYYEQNKEEILRRQRENRLKNKEN